jgi:1-acyl-sn-glycerol-3-phosphate acyltransferase
MAKQSITNTGPDSFAFHPPSRAFVKNFMVPFNFYFSPQYYGEDELDVSKPAMYVSNHTVLGVLDGFPFATDLYVKKGVFLRSLADSNHFMIPGWRDVVTDKLGAVEASRDNCRGLMHKGQSLLVFPGGTREICKKKGEKYVLKWSDRRGFVRMAMEFGYDIIPVAAVGAEEAYTILRDANEILKTPFGNFLKFTGVAEKYFKNGELMPPIVGGIGNSIIPRPAKLYFKFGKRIHTARYKSKFEDLKTQEMMKAKVEESLYKSFGELFEIRDNDRDRGKWRRFFNMKKPKS